MRTWPQELFLTDDPRRAQTLAMALCEQNKQRQATENQILEQALQKLRREYDPLEDQVIVLAGEDWHHGVIGIVSSRICDRYACPTVLIALEDGIGKGSGRSVKGFNLYEALCDSAPLLERFGGHELAAGLTIREENIQQFHENMEAWAREHVNPQELMPILHIDCPIAPEFISTEATRGLDVLEPFGMGNPQPVFFHVRSAGRGDYAHFVRPPCAADAVQGWPDLHGYAVRYRTGRMRLCAGQLCGRGILSGDQ